MTITRKFKIVEEVVAAVHKKEVPNGFTIEISEDLAQFFAAMAGMSNINRTAVPEKFRDIAEEFYRIGSQINKAIDREYMFVAQDQVQAMFTQETKLTGWKKSK